MPLPLDDITWPPIAMMAVYSKMAEWAAWYSSEPSRIVAVYAMNNASTQSNPWWRFWSRARQGTDGAQRAIMHVPIASDLAATSAALLFGEPVTVRIRSAHDDKPDPEEPMPMIGDMRSAGGMMLPRKKPVHTMTPEDKAEARLLQIMEDGGFNARLIEAAESAAAIGGVYIYPVWDENLRPFPILGVAQSDMAVPEFQHGILTAVTFHRTVSKDGSKQIWRHLERHEMVGTGADRHCQILNGYYNGTEDRLGIQMGLGIGDNITGEELKPVIDTPFKELDVEYIPNMRPNRLWRASGFGIADIQGSETLLDALDETYASWMRDIRLAKARIIVPREYLRPDPNDKQEPAFDLDQEVYVAMDMEPSINSGNAQSMFAHQFEIRFNEHQETARDLIDRIVSNAGYAPATLGHNAEMRATGTGTALRISEHKTLLTLRRKAGWWRPAISNVLYHFQQVDCEYFGQSTPCIRPTVTISDSIIDQPLELAQTALALMTAQSASIETRVRIVKPDWSEQEIEQEVDRIKEENGINQLPPPEALGGPMSVGGRFGNPKTDAASTSILPVTGDKGPAPTNPPPVSPPFAPKA